MAESKTLFQRALDREASQANTKNVKFSSLDEVWSNRSLFETISMTYDKFDNNVDCVYTITGQGNFLVEETMTEEQYKDWLSTNMNIDFKSGRQYNESITIEQPLLLTRCFFMLPPYTKNPYVVCSMANKPKGDLPSLSQFAQDLTFDKIVNSNFIIVGATGSGKTYLLNNIIQHGFMDTDKKLLFVEEFRELFKPNEFTNTVTIPPRLPTEGDEVFEHAIQQSNLLRIDRLYVGEIKGAEAWPFINNLYSGVRGGCTIHGSSCEDGLRRLQLFCQKYVSPEEAGKYIGSTIEYVIYIENHEIKKVKRLSGVFTDTGVWQEKALSDSGNQIGG